MLYVGVCSLECRRGFVVMGWGGGSNCRELATIRDDPQRSCSCRAESHGGIVIDKKREDTCI